MTSFTQDEPARGCSGELARLSGTLARRQIVFLKGLVVATFLGCLIVAGIAHAQQPRKTKIPRIGKIEGGSIRQAFTGKVLSWDTQHKVLNVNAAEGGGTEIFPVKKSVQVRSANGDKLKLAELKSGSNVIIYYEQKGSQRTVTEIIVLAAGKEEAKKKSPPPS